MDSFQTSYLNDDSTRHKLNRSMSLSELSPRKDISIHKKLVSGSLGDVVYQQCSYEELSVIPGTSSLQFSRKFVSELHVNLSGNTFNPDVEISKAVKNYDFKKFGTSTKKISEIALNDKEIEHYRKRPHEPSDTMADFKRKKRCRVTPKFIKLGPMKLGNSESLSNSHINEENNSRKTRMLWIVIPVLLVVCGTFGTQYAAYHKACDSELDVNALECLLGSTIFGQEKAVKEIVETIRGFSSRNEYLQVLIFSGATGVGKTYTASLIEEVFPWKHNIHHFIMPIDFESLPHLVQKFPYCGDHLVIMDDLKDEDIKYIEYIVSFLKRMPEKSKVTAVLIFKFHKQLSGNISEADVIQKSNIVQTNLNQRGVTCNIINFKSLEKNDVIKCIKEALKRHWITVSDEAVNTVLNQVDYKNEGCKRISSKIAVVNELWTRHL